MNDHNYKLNHRYELWFEVTWPILFGPIQSTGGTGVSYFFFVIPPPLVHLDLSKSPVTFFSRRTGPDTKIMVY